MSKSTPINTKSRILRHGRMMWKSIRRYEPSSPPFLTLFVTSRCNLCCDHCFYWQNLNQPDDLSLDEIREISDGLGDLENLNISGGEPFLRKDLSEICRQFVERNRVKQIYITTNAYFTEDMRRQIQGILESPALSLLVVEISLDGLKEYHNRLRGNRESFQKAMESYYMLEGLRKRDERMRIHVDSTVSSENIAEIRNLSKYLYDHCPSVEHHGIAVIRGDWKNKDIEEPPAEDFRNLCEYVERLWSDRGKKRFGWVVEPMSQWARYSIMMNRRQVVACLAGILSAVVYPNGDLGVCELHPPVGNLRKKSFLDLWHSQEARGLRSEIKAKKCYCTHEIPLWSSIVFQPVELVRAMLGSRIWKRFPL